ncbi:hypothetical protein OF83DRAFT_1178040 [Amylostereum chailletii]|nr:hypothetical protein OF83DRAFT_1178040 [Amylostereum chailletii]
MPPLQTSLSASLAELPQEEILDAKDNKPVGTTTCAKWLTLKEVLAQFDKDFKQFERECLCKEGSCFLCRQPGHMLRDCLNKDSSSGRRVGALETDSNSGVPSAPASLFPQAATISNADLVKEMSVLINKMKNLGKEECEEAMAMLKDLAGSLDF